MMKNLFLLPFLSFLAGCGSGSTLPPIYLGHVATTSGPGKAVGEREVWGIRLAIEELTRAGQNLVGGRPVVVKHTDAHGQLETLQGEAVRLVNVSRVIALYGGNTNAEVQRLEPTGVPLVTPLGGKAQRLTFPIGISPSVQAEALARFAVLKKGVKGVAILVDQRLDEARAYADAFQRAFQKAIDEKKEAIVKPLVIPFGKDAKFADLNQGIDPAKVQGILFAGSQQDYLEWGKTLPASTFMVFFGGLEEGYPETGPISAYRARAFAVDKDLPKTGEFAKVFREAYKEDPDAHAALAYDGIRLLIDAMKRTQASGGESLQEELGKTKDFPGLTGPISFGAERPLQRPVFVGRLVGSQFEVEKRYEP